MPTLQTLVERQKAAILANAARITETYARTVLAPLVLRTQSSGITGARYSTKEVPTFWFAGKELNQGGAQYIDDNDLGNWKGFREAQGLPGNIVTATYSGKTIRSLTAAPAGVTGYVYRAKLVAGDAESAVIVGHLLARYPKWLTPETSEVAAGLDYVRAETRRVLQQAANA